MINDETYNQMCAGVGGVFVGRGRGEGVCGGIDCPISDGVLEVYYINRIIHLGPIPRNLLFKVEFEKSFFCPKLPWTRLWILFVGKNGKTCECIMLWLYEIVYNIRIQDPHKRASVLGGGYLYNA